MSDIEKRLRADAARRHEASPPPFDAALDAAIGGGRSGRRVTLTALAVAASVVAVAALAAGVSGYFGGHHTPAGGEPTVSSGPIVDGASVDRVFTDPGRDPRRIAVMVSKPGVASCDLVPFVTVAQQDATSVRLSVVVRRRIFPPDGPAPSPADTGAPSGPASVIRAGGEASGGDTNGAGPTGVITAGGETSGAGPTSGAPPGEGSRCDLYPPYGDVLVARAPGTRAIYVNGTRFVLMDNRFNAEATVPPDGYSLIENADTGRPAADGTIVNKYADGDGNVFWISYGPPQSVNAKGTAAGSATVGPYRATVSTADGQRWLTWTLDTGAVVQLYSRAAPPLSVAQMVRVAGTLSY